MTASGRIPLFPLGTPLLPGVVMPLHIFEERYRALIRDLLEAAQDDEPVAFGVVAIRAGHEVGEHSATALHDVGCLAVLQEVAAFPDGRYAVGTVGTRRFHLDRVLSAATPYLQADVQWLPDTPGDVPSELDGRVRSAVGRYSRALAGAGSVAQDPALQDPGRLPSDPVALSYAVGAAIALPTVDQQRVLAAADAGARLRLLLDLMAREESLLGRLHTVPAEDFLRTGVSPN